MRYSLEGKLTLILSIGACAGVAAGVIAAVLIGNAWLAVLAALCVILPLALYAGRSLATKSARTLLAVTDGVRSMKDRDYSLSITRTTTDEVGELVDSYNSLAGILRQERQTLHQRELLLDTVIQATPVAMLLVARDRIIFSNLAARRLFLDGKGFEGVALTQLLAQVPAPLREAVEAGADTLFTIERGAEHDVFHLSQRRFLLNGQTHWLLLLKELTRELGRQEVETWKKVIRVIAHELNNSLAPISSLAHSGTRVLESPEREQLERIFATIEERARHLHTFIDGYARFAKLPHPRMEEIDWAAFLESLRRTTEFQIADIPKRPATFDATQIEQVLINVVKNAREAGSPTDEIIVRVTEEHGGWQIEIRDRGSGMSEDVLQQALLPFYSTKPSGAGLGLTLCREIIEAHAGRIALANRADGGFVVTLWLPGDGKEE